MRNVELYEDKQRGTKDFPIEIYQVDKNYPQYIMPAHWHNEFEIIRILKGSFDLFINNNQIHLIEEDIAFINCKELHRGQPNDCEYECVVLDLQVMRDFNKDIFISYIEPLTNGTFEIINFSDNKNTKLKQLVNEFFEALKFKKPFFKLKILSNIYALLELFYTENFVIEMNMSKKLIKQSSIVAELITWIDNNYSENITLPLLAAKAGLSPSYLCKLFKDYTGKSLFEYINYVRIENICLEINEGQKNITAIATNNGYNDISYFCKVFKKQVGISAKNYAKLRNGTKAF